MVLLRSFYKKSHFEITKVHYYVKSTIMLLTIMCDKQYLSTIVSFNICCIPYLFSVKFEFSSLLLNYNDLKKNSYNKTGFINSTLSFFYKSVGFSRSYEVDLSLIDYPT